ncbi:hypothetical protein [Methylocystis bryophila]|uniref:Uncharacterized protein n=1 Tax=Methylocystis bryophila TaxID=655015 RepID=A0A1W6MW67_9HYPH|nr:hypothetical protein [Methylocystis bryophila]ARN81833.1 hypothetical protein B1812_12920 [Methylocystis bryophila]BDV37906.1 hypothetical protein DSM21852_11590 [Methylocystis bryophila]
MVEVNSFYMATVGEARGATQAYPPEHYRSQAEVLRKQTNLAARLPEGRPREKFTRLEELIAERHALHDLLQRRFEEARELKQAQALRVREFELQPVTGDGALTVERAELARLAAEVAPVAERRAEAWKKHEPEVALFARTRDYVRDQAQDLAPFDAPPAPPLAPGESHADAIDAARAEVFAIRGKLQDIDFAPYPSDWCKQRARAQIDALAERGRVNVSPSVDTGAPAIFPGLSFREVDKEIPDGLALVAWLHRDALIARVEREIDENSDDRSALDPGQRKSLRAELEAALLAAERIEEAAIVAAEAAGVLIVRRADADIRSFLEISGPAPRR